MVGGRGQAEQWYVHGKQRVTEEGAGLGLRCRSPDVWLAACARNLLVVGCFGNGVQSFYLWAESCRSLRQLRIYCF